MLELNEAGVAQPGTSVGLPNAQFDSTKSQRILGLKYRPLRETLQESLASLREKFPNEFKV